MRAQLLHLSGPQRGRTITYDQKRLLLGTAPDADVRFPEGTHTARRHAELTFVEEGCAFYLKALEGKVFVNRREVKEVILEHGDLLELGIDGPKIRFRLQAEPGRACKPVRLMLNDAREVRAQSGLGASVHALRRDLLVHTTRTFRVRAAIVLLAAAVAVAYLGGLMGSVRTARKERDLREAQARRFAEELARIRGRMEQFQREQAGHATQEEVDALREELARRAMVVEELTRRTAALRRVLEEYSAGVCLIFGAYEFRYEKDGASLVVTDVVGDPLVVEYIGSGFLASADGLVVTNRHVAQPWWNNDVVQPLLDAGAEPAFVRLTASFPGRAPVDVNPSTIRLSEEGVDLAVLRAEVNGVPVLPLHEGALSAARGERVILMGYPTGLTAVLARADEEVVEQAMSEASDTQGLIEALARRSAIFPVITQGALNEVRPLRLVYDAETTSGGSGGPVFGVSGTVIGVNFAVTRDFGGTNFGVPIRFARNLLRGAGEPEHSGTNESTP